MIELTRVESSQIAAYGYDQLTRTLAIEFPTGAIYHYANVAPDYWKCFQLAKSKGSWFIGNIKKFPGLYPYTKVREGRATSQQ
jgi:hypothetical protein